MKLELIDWLILGILCAGAILAFARLWLGPYAPDRIVAADTLSVLATAGIVLLALFLDSPLYLDVALIYGVLAFVGVVALARTIEAGSKGDPT